MTQHDDRDLEERLRRYQPAGPPDELRRRVMRAAEGENAGRSLWPFWSLAAASVVALVVLQVLTAQTYRGVWRAVDVDRERARERASHATNDRVWRYAERQGRGRAPRRPS